MISAAKIQAKIAVVHANARENPPGMAKWLKTKDLIWRRGWDSNLLRTRDR
jgi:hypothetical protein